MAYTASKRPFWAVCEENLVGHGRQPLSHAQEVEPEILPPASGRSGPRPGLTAGDAAGARGFRSSPADDPLYETAQAAHQYMEEAKAAATRRAYSSDWRHFAAWCDQNGLASLPASPSTVALYLTSLAKPAEGEKPRKAATITRRLTSINAAHKEKGLDSPATMNHRLVADTLHGIRRTPRRRPDQEEAAHPGPDREAAGRRSRARSPRRATRRFC